MFRVTLKLKILLYLSEFSKYRGIHENGDEIAIYPEEITQEGIAKAVGITVSHVPRELKDLINDGLVEEIKGRVKNRTKRINVYFLSPMGIAEVNKIKNEIGNREIEFNNKIYKVKDLIEKYKFMTWLDYFNNYLIQQKKDGEFSNIYHVENLINTKLINRNIELRKINEWYQSEIPFLVIIGARGSGKTAIISKFISVIKNIDNVDIIMISLTENADIEFLKKKLEEIYKKSKSFEEIILKTDNLIILDNYYRVSEELVEFLNSILYKKSRGKMIIIMREEIPVYMRFYHLEDIKNGKVNELYIRNLPLDAVREFFNDIKEEEKLKIIYRLTGGKPSLLVYLKNFDEEGLVKNSTLTADQAKFLIDIVKGQAKDSESPKG
ncbi:MAG: ATP-binding protein [Thermoplasmata archaeon]|jgi:DNA-binding MarR family transcriptional regulator